MTALRRYKVTFDEEPTIYIVADRFDLGDIWVTFYARNLDGGELVTAALMADTVVAIVDEAATAQRPPREPRANDAKQTAPLRLREPITTDPT